MDKGAKDSVYNRLIEDTDRIVALEQFADAGPRPTAFDIVLNMNGPRRRRALEENDIVQKRFDDTQFEMGLPDWWPDEYKKVYNQRLKELHSDRTQRIDKTTPTID
jgi:hypothetical protein